MSLQGTTRTDPYERVYAYGSYHGSMAAKLLAAHRPFPGTCSSRSVSGVCGIERCSPRPVPLPVNRPELRSPELSRPQCSLSALAISQQLRSWGCNSRAGRPDFGPSRKNASENEALYCCCDGADSNGFMVGQIACPGISPSLTPEQRPGLEQASPLRTHAEPHPPPPPGRTSFSGTPDSSGR